MLLSWFGLRLVLTSPKTTVFLVFILTNRKDQERPWTSTVSGPKQSLGLNLEALW